MWKYIILIIVTVEVFGVSLDGVYFTLKDVVFVTLNTIIEKNQLGWFPVRNFGVMNSSQSLETLGFRME